MVTFSSLRKWILEMIDRKVLKEDWKVGAINLFRSSSNGYFNQIPSQTMTSTFFMFFFLTKAPAFNTMNERRNVPMCLQIPDRHSRNGTFCEKQTFLTANSSLLVQQNLVILWYKLTDSMIFFSKHIFTPQEKIWALFLHFQIFLREINFLTISERFEKMFPGIFMCMYQHNRKHVFHVIVINFRFRLWSNVPRWVPP